MPELTTWQATVKKKKDYPSLRRNAETDILIVGGGLTGVITAYLLAREGREVTLIEKGKIGSGTTAWTTAFITEDLDTELAKLKGMFGQKGARLAWESHRAGIDLLEDLASEEEISCDFKRVPCYVYSFSHKDAGMLEAERVAAEKIGFRTEVRKRDLRIGAEVFWRIPDQAKFHPLKFLYVLSERARALGVRIHEKTEATSIKGGVVSLKNGRTIKAKHMISATYYPFDKPKKTFMKKGMYVSYVLEAEIPRFLEEAIYLDTDNPYNYFRVDSLSKTRDRIILGGGDHRSEIKMPARRVFGFLEEYLKKILNGRKYRITRTWTGPILEPSDGLALIGKTASGRYTATAFSGNGMTYAAIAGMLLADLLQGRTNPWTVIYDPRRRMRLKSLAGKAADYGEELLKGVPRSLLHRKRPN